ncbi:ribose-5-phosphate isomerase [Clostridium sp. DJ247]|uniref:ribose-5-phosphate isomerase n=1 Tax=Clostridium sp. DJ247 TaxID=2726188 RepID=UPI001629869C|nr:ribose-5-phosphate isomerase [Clostridium sp. DJ247]MBC2579884.1 ribose-5-phosphate isomerase [Clostridium sp. DJ247]
MAQYFSDKEVKYERIINLLCKYKGLSREELFKILKDNDCKYLFFLLIKKYGCNEIDMIKKDFPSMSKNTMNTNFRRAQEKMLLNRQIRNMYFEAEDIIENTK